MHEGRIEDAEWQGKGGTEAGLRAYMVWIEDTQGQDRKYTGVG